MQAQLSQSVSKGRVIIINFYYTVCLNPSSTERLVCNIWPLLFKFLGCQNVGFKIIEISTAAATAQDPIKHFVLGCSNVIGLLTGSSHFTQRSIIKVHCGSDLAIVYIGKT